MSAYTRADPNLSAVIKYWAAWSVTGEAVDGYSLAYPHCFEIKIIGKRNPLSSTKIQHCCGQEFSYGISAYDCFFLRQLQNDKSLEQ